MEDNKRNFGPLLLYRNPVCFLEIIDLFMIITCKGLNLESAFMSLGVSNSVDNKDGCPALCIVGGRRVSPIFLH